MIGLFYLPLVSLSATPIQSESIELRESDRLMAAFLPVGLKFTVHEKILSQDPSGGYRIEIQQRNDGVNWGGEALLPSKEMSMESFQVSAQGEILEANLADYDEGWGSRSFQLEEAPLPLAIPKMGESWGIDFKKNDVTKAISAHGNYKYIKDTDLFGYDAIEIEIHVKELTGAAPATSDGVVWLRKSDHFPLGFRLKLTNTAFPGIPGLADASLERLPAKR